MLIQLKTKQLSNPIPSPPHLLTFPASSTQPGGLSVVSAASAAGAGLLWFRTTELKSSKGF